MKNLLFTFLLSGWMLANVTHSNAALVTGGIQYDPEKMAISIDLNHPEWDQFNRLEIDFNNDHTWAQIIDGSERVFRDGQQVRRFEFGIYRNLNFPDGRTVRYFGWSHNPLFENEPRLSWLAFVDKLYYGEVSPDKLQCYTDEWTPLTGAMSVYCQRVDETGNSIPVLPDDLDQTFVRLSETEWISLSALQVQNTPPLLAEMTVSPSSINRRSKGKTILVKIDLPANQAHELSNVDINVAVNPANDSGDVPIEVHLKPLKWCGKIYGSSEGRDHVIFKISRSELVNLPAGDASLTLTGELEGGERVRAEGQITLQ
ncbi:MAG: hypothetical protein C0615_12460 [Desulfuromonas sp.]|nr:MAG: hypothetical protein C0615_12460 [Desulfuromonas sp.]